MLESAGIAPEAECENAPAASQRLLYHAARTYRAVETYATKHSSVAFTSVCVNVIKANAEAAHRDQWLRVLVAHSRKRYSAVQVWSASEGAKKPETVGGILVRKDVVPRVRRARKHVAGF